MKRLPTAVLASMLALLPAAATAPVYTPFELSGFNADLINMPGEANVTDRTFYTEEVELHGGLPREFKGIFSGVSYSIADPAKVCALRVLPGQPYVLEIGNTRYAKGVWLLGEPNASTCSLKITLRFTDGSTEEHTGMTFGDAAGGVYGGAAFRLLGKIDPLGNYSDGHALYELSLPVGKTKKIGAIIFDSEEGGADIFAATASNTAPDASAIRERKLFFMSDSHLDTQWNWTVRQTIEQYMRNTLSQNFERFADSASPNFQFNFEGAIKYMWAKEYYPDLYELLKSYIQAGRWHVAGGSVDANDVNVGSAESQIRNFLYGQQFYRREFGVRGGRDVMLPDCFGFPYSLPTIAAHCGMKYFHTNKLAWNSAYAYSRLPRYARWRGPDGAELLAVLKTNPYDDHEVFRKDMSKDASMLSEANSNYSTYGIPAAIKYVGPRSDRGGGLDKETADWLSASVDGSGSLGVELGSTTSLLDRLFHMASDDKLPVIDHGLPMRAHGVGGYTSRTMLKYWTRKGEVAAAAAEGASVAADWLGALEYQHKTLTDAWTRLVWHQFHDDLPGTSIEQAYVFSVNDLVLSQLDFGRTLDNAAGAVAANISTDWTQNRPVVVYNPLATARTDAVEAEIDMPEDMFGVKVFAAGGVEVPSQVLWHQGDRAGIVFLATVPSLGCASFDVTCTTTPNNLSASITASTTAMENSRYRVLFDANGDVCSVIDKSLNNKELLEAPIRLQMLYDESTSWPSWEIHGDQLQKAPRETVDSEGLQMEVVENGPVRASVKISRTKGGSTFVQYVRLAEGDAAARLDFVNEVDWQSRERLLKVAFPLTASNAKATYDLSIGVDENANSMTYSTDHNNTDAVCEFLGHRWADVSDQSGSFGVSVLNDCKYGWDKQSDNVLRLTLIHTPKAGNYAYQGNQDIGLNRFTYSLMAHGGTWDASTPWQADRLNSPMKAYLTDKHTGALGASFGFVSVDNDGVAIKAIKRAEDDANTTVVRFHELTGEARHANVTFPAQILAARQVNGVEETVGTADFSGNVLKVDIEAFQPKAYAVVLAKNTQAVAGLPSGGTTVEIPFDVDVISGNDNRADAETNIAFPAELITPQIVADGITFATGSTADGAKNAVRCNGQEINLPELANGKVYILASSLNPDGSNVEFGIDGAQIALHVAPWDGNVGYLSNSTEESTEYRLENTAFTATHSHNAKNGTEKAYAFMYMYKNCLGKSNGTAKLILPSDPDVLVYAVTVAENANDDAVPALSTPNVLVHTDTADPYKGSVQSDPVLWPADVTASGYVNDSEAPSMANDNDESTKWCDNSSAAKWLEYRFEKPVTITGWRVVNAGGESMDYLAGEYTLQRFVDGGWVDVDGVRNNTVNITNRVLEAPFVTDAVRLYMKAGAGNKRGGTARVFDFKVYGHTPLEGDELVPQIISRRPSFGTGRQNAVVMESSGRVNASEDAQFLLDADPTTKWCYNGSNNAPEVLVKLHGVYKLSRFDIHDCKTNEHYPNSGSFAIAVSTDGENFTTVASASGVEDENIHSVTLEQSVEASWVKLNIDKGADGCVRIYAFDIWGVKTAELPFVQDEPLSTGRTVLGASAMDSYDKSPLHLLDGRVDNAEMVWKAPYPGSVAAKTWVVVDLERECTVESFAIADAGTRNGGANVKSYSIAVSNTPPTHAELSTNGGDNWQTVASNIANASASKQYTLAAPVNARYVKLEIPGSAISAAAHLHEFEVYGNENGSGIAQASTGSGISVWPLRAKAGEDINILSPGKTSWNLSTLSALVLAEGKCADAGQVSTSALAPGIYLLSVQNDKEKICRKIIVE